jgi:PAS domain S-box-containing protein
MANVQTTKKEKELIVEIQELRKQLNDTKKSFSEKLQESEDLFHSLAENIPQLCWMTNADGWIFWYNKRWYDYTGTTPEQMEGWGWKSVHHPDHIDSVLNNWTNALKLKESWEDTFPLRNANGEFRWFLSRAFPIRNERGEIIRWFGTNTDITESKIAEQALKDSIERIEFAEHAAKIGFWDWDMVSDKLIWSKEFFGLFGLETSAEQTFETFLSAVHPDDREAVMAQINRSIEDRIQLENEYRVIHPDGKVHWIGAWGNTLYNPAGKPLRMSGICSDITERKKAEEAIAASEREFRLLTESMPQIVWTTRADGWNTYFNHKWVEYTGLTLEESYGEGWNKPFHPDDQKMAWEAWQNAVLNNGPYLLQCRLRRADGVYRYWLIHGVPVRDSQGKIIKWYGTCTDIDDMRQASEALSKSEAQLRELNATKDKFFNILAHDLKNPFTTLLGSTELLHNNIDNLNTESIRRLAQLLNESAKNGYAILLNLLDWSRSQTGLIKVNPEKINLRQLIDENISDLNLYSISKKIKMNSEIKTDMYIFADKNMIITVIRNLLSNAVKFTPHNGMVNVSCMVSGTELTVSVKDTGIGIPAENIDKLFRLDSKLSKPGTDKEQGTGLGLKLSKEFIEKMGGKIWVESAENIGSEFKFSIPVGE